MRKLPAGKPEEANARLIPYPHNAVRGKRERKTGNVSSERRGGHPRGGGMGCLHGHRGVAALGHNPGAGRLRGRQADGEVQAECHARHTAGDRTKTVFTAVPAAADGLLKTARAGAAANTAAGSVRDTEREP